MPIAGRPCPRKPHPHPTHPVDAPSSALMHRPFQRQPPATVLPNSPTMWTGFTRHTCTHDSVKGQSFLRRGNRLLNPLIEPWKGGVTSVQARAAPVWGDGGLPWKQAVRQRALERLPRGSHTDGHEAKGEWERGREQNGRCGKREGSASVGVCMGATAPHTFTRVVYARSGSGERETTSKRLRGIAETLSACWCALGGLTLPAQRRMGPALGSRSDRDSMPGCSAGSAVSMRPRVRVIPCVCM
jgi:hypothetical protein